MHRQVTPNHGEIVLLTDDAAADDLGPIVAWER
jgi:hypothetical protein